MHRMKTLSIALMAIGLTAAVGCKKDKLPEDPGNTEPSSSMIDKTFTASIAEVAIKQDIALSTTDLIAMYDGYGKSTYNIASVDEQGKAEIKGQVDSRATVFQAVYPYSAANAYTAGQEISVYIPDSQRISTGETASASALVCMGKEASGNILFESIVSYLELEVPEGTTQVTVRGEASGPIAGDVYVAEDGSINAKDAAWTPETEQSVTIVPDGETFAAGTYYVCLLPATFGNGFTIVYQSASATEAKATSEAVEFKANAIVDAAGLAMGETETGTETDPFTISTAEELMALGGETYAAGVYVKLTADIDMEGKTWTPYTLNCNLDGDGHKVYNISVSGTDNAAMFTTVYGTLKNLTVGSEDGENYDGKSVITMTGNGQKTGLVQNNNGTMENVVNFVKIIANADGNAGSEVRVGGIAASNYSALIGCENRGDIELTGTSGTLAYVGGITGWASDGDVTISESSNYGNITVDHSNTQGIAGIAGMNRGQNFTDCKNYGKITVKNSVAQNSFAGGILGYVQNLDDAEKKVSGCENHGEFDIQATTVAGVAGIAGCVHMYCMAPVIMENCKNESEISVTTANGWMLVGGILANVAMPGDVSAAGNFTNKITGCTNNGDITLGAPSGAGKSGVARIGGIVGSASKKIIVENSTNAGDITSTKLTACHAGGIVGYSDCEEMSLSQNTNSGVVKLYPAQSEPVECYAGGIIATSLCTVKSEISGNTNSAAEVSIVCNSAAASYSPLSYVGGIIGSSNDVLCTTSGNTNEAAVISETASIWVPTGGIAGIVRGNISMNEDVNSGDVTLASTHATTGDMFAGGIVGIFHMEGTAETKGAEKAVVNKVKSTGNLKSSGRCGFVGNSAWSNYGSITVTDCVFGGSIAANSGSAVAAADAGIEEGNNLFGYINAGDTGNTVYTQSGNKAE